MNKAIFDGNLAKDPEIRYTQSGTAVCNFTLGVNSGWGDKKRTDWLSVVVWGKMAEACNKNLAKGSKVLVEARIQTRSYDGKDGNKRYVTEFVGSNVEFLGSKKNDAQPTESSYGEPVSDEDIPF